MEFHYSVTTDKTIDQAVEALEANLKTRKFGVLWKLDIAATLQEKGVDYKTPYRVLEVCNPQEANRVLTQNPLVGYFLPCKVVVYEGKDGKTTIGLPRPTTMMNIIDDPELASIAEGVENTLIASIDDVK